MQKPSLLIVEDEPGFSRLIALSLSREGFEVHTVPNGEDALDLAAEIHPDAVVDHRRELDQDLPGCASEIENARSAQPAAELAQVTNSRREFGRPRRVGAMLRTP